MLVAEALSESTAVTVTVWALLLGSSGLAAAVAMWVRLDGRVNEATKLARRANAKASWARHWILVETGKREDSQPIDLSSLGE